MKQFFKQLNTRQLIIQFLAIILITFSCHVLASLYDFDFLYKKGTVPSFMFVGRHERDLKIIDFAGSIGQIIAFLIFWRISSKRSWYWVNAVIVFVVAFVLNNFNHLGWSWLRGLLLLPGSIFGEGSMVGVITNGTIMLALALWLILSKKIWRFIDRGVNKPLDNGALKVNLAGNQKKKQRLL